jgi:hypothetical protein
MTAVPHDARASAAGRLSSRHSAAVYCWKADTLLPEALSL